VLSGDLGDFGAFFLFMRVWYIRKTFQKALMPCVRKPGRPCVERRFAGYRPQPYGAREAPEDVLAQPRTRLRQ
jgi:hypothetical protein